jgi:hypothetical protein
MLMLMFNVLVLWNPPLASSSAYALISAALNWVSLRSQDHAPEGSGLSAERTQITSFREALARQAKVIVRCSRTGCEVEAMAV